ncbi:MAG: hypothetical protein WCF67_03905 [Chitinophagaceae bacterium]
MFPASNIDIKFIWQGDSAGSGWEPFAALLIPVKLANCPKQFYMQFDTGAPYSVFYRDQLKAIQAKYPAIHLNDSSTRLMNTSFTIGKQKIECIDAGVIQSGDPSINWKNKNSIEIIGTLGVDFIDNRTAVIDYRGGEMLIGTAIPESITSGISFTDFMYMRNSILLPAVIRGKKTILYFDTGASAFELLTSKEICTSLAAPGATPVQYKVRSWDKFMTANTFTTNDSLSIASRKIAIRKATYMEGASDSQVQQMLKMGIGGMTGNKLFINSILVLDTKNRKFGIAD